MSGRYGLVWWLGCGYWHFPQDEPSGRDDPLECGQRIPMRGRVSWSTDPLTQVQLMDLCPKCIERRARRFTETRAEARIAKAIRLEPNDAA